MPHKLALIGFGTVGQGLAEILRDKADELGARYSFETQVVAITTATRGTIYHPSGLDINTALTTIQETGSLNDYPEAPGLVRGWDSLATIRDSNADTVVETTWTDLETGEPATSHIRSAFETGKNVVTSNRLRKLYCSLPAGTSRFDEAQRRIVPRGDSAPQRGFATVFPHSTIRAPPGDQPSLPGKPRWRQAAPERPARSATHRPHAILVARPSLPHAKPAGQEARRNDTTL